MGQFIKYLIEASTITESKSGPVAWNFYYRGHGPTETKTKHNAKLYDLEGVDTGLRINAGTPITVNGEDAEYQSKIHIIYNNKHYRIPLTDISKPIAAARRFGYLKPDRMGLADQEFTMAEYADKVHKAIEKFTAPKEVKEYLNALVNWCLDPSLEKELHDAWTRSGMRGNLFEIGTLNNDFLEVLGPLIIPEGTPSSTVYFPSRGNEPLYDFTVDDVRYSSKRLTGLVNTLKVDHILDTAKNDPSAMEEINRSKGARNGMEVMQIIKSNSVREAGKALDAWLNYHQYADPQLDTKQFNPTMRSVEKRLNAMIAANQLNCDVAINSAMTNVVFCKSEIDPSTGIVLVDEDNATAPRHFSNVRFRYKGRDNEKLGFDLN